MTAASYCDMNRLETRIKIGIKMNSQDILRSALKGVMKRRGLTQVRLSEITGFPRPHISNLMNGSRKVAQKSVDKYFGKFLLAEEKKKLRKAFEYEAGDWHREGSIDLHNVRADGKISISEDQKAFTSDPRCFAAVHLFDLKECDGTAKWFSERLGTTKTKARAILDLLEKLGVCQKKGDKFRKKVQCVRMDKNSDTKSQMTLRKHLLQYQEDALAKPREEVVFFDWFSAISEADIPEFRSFIEKKIIEFDRKQLGSKPKKVYAFSVGLYPIEKG